MRGSGSSNKRRYYCRDCGRHKWIPGRGDELPRTIRTGCEHCEFIATHKQVGVR